jgi:hypothetical protein
MHFRAGASTLADAIRNFRNVAPVVAGMKSLVPRPAAAGPIDECRAIVRKKTAARSRKRPKSGRSLRQARALRTLAPVIWAFASIKTRCGGWAH